MEYAFTHPLYGKGIREIRELPWNVFFLRNLDFFVSSCMDGAWWFIPTQRFLFFPLRNT